MTCWQWERATSQIITRPHLSTYCCICFNVQVLHHLIQSISEAQFFAQDDSAYLPQISESKPCRDYHRCRDWHRPRREQMKGNKLSILGENTHRGQPCGLPQRKTLREKKKACCLTISSLKKLRATESNCRCKCSLRWAGDLTAKRCSQIVTSAIPHPALRD